MFNEVFFEKDYFLETVKGQVWNTPEEMEFFGHFYDYVSKMEKKVHRTRRNWKKEGDELVEYTKGEIKELDQKYEELSG